MKTFDFYEFTGVLTPGAMFLYAIARISPETAPFITAKDFTLGSLGLFVILAYVAGHLVQAVGNLLENAFWKPFGGMPTNWLQKANQRLLSEPQMALFPEKLRQLTGISLTKPVFDLDNRQWYPITRQVYAAVLAAGRAQRVDTFNGNYGMFRGIASAFIICAVLNLVIHHCAGWKVSLGLLIAGVLALIRMRRFGVHYARELFIQFLQIQKEKPLS